MTIVSALSPEKVTAGACGYEECWGAVGTGPGQAFGYAFGKWSEEEAYRTLQIRCGWKCTNVRSFFNTCGAIAKGENKRWSFAANPDLGTAQRNALQQCGLQSIGCEIEVWACSP